LAVASIPGGATSMVGFANGRVGWVAKTRWPILPSAHPLEKSAPDFMDISIYRLPPK
jgi:hypothetical protein